MIDAYIALVEAVNAATTETDHRIADARRAGWLDCYRAGRSDIAVGGLVIAADLHYLDQGIDRPMCGGVWLDWVPADAALTGGAR